MNCSKGDEYNKLIIDRLRCDHDFRPTQKTRYIENGAELERTTFLENFLELADRFILESIQGTQISSSRIWYEDICIRCGLSMGKCGIPPWGSLRAKTN